MRHRWIQQSGVDIRLSDFGFKKKSQAKKARDGLGGPSVVFSNRNANILERENEEKKLIPTWSSK